MMGLSAGLACRSGSVTIKCMPCSRDARALEEPQGPINLKALRAVVVIQKAMSTTLSASQKMKGVVSW